MAIGTVPAGDRIRVSDGANARNGLWRPFSGFVASAGFLCGIALVVGSQGQSAVRPNPVAALPQSAPGRGSIEPLPPPRAPLHRIIAAREFARWNKAGGRVLKGLSNRRAAEAELYRSAQ